MLERVQLELGKGLEAKEEWMRELGVLSREKRRLRVTLFL